MKITFLPHVISDKLVRRFTPREPGLFSDGDMQSLCNLLKADNNGNNQINDATVEDGSVKITVKHTDGWVSSYFNPHERLEVHATYLLTCRDRTSHDTIAA
jgi:hypothetical protein